MIMKKQYYILYIIMCALLVTGCSDDDFFGQDSLTKEQKALIGRAVNFNPSMAEEFGGTRASYDHNGGFNEGDIMQIYRQYWGNGDWEEKQAYRTYHYDVTYATGTSINLQTDWKVCVGRMKGDNWVSSANPGTMEPQEKGDSLTWDNGRTVRFRAWSRSNVAGCIGNGSAGSYYPDFCVADWVTVSGPTEGIPLTLRHLCSRIAFTYKAGNQFAGGEVCLDKEDYMWKDNADSHENDEADKMTEEEAEATVAKVREVFDKMCLPAGVDIEGGTLKAMTKDLYNDLKNNSQFNIIEQKTKNDGIVFFGEQTPEYIKNKVQHPSFSNVDGRLYMMTIPYDMSNSSTKGDVLVLPPETRFKIKIRDVNNGDAANTSGYEAKEHIFSLSDIKDSNGDTKYSNGLQLMPGKGYLFSVGYQYDQLTVTVIEEGLHWSTADEEDGNAIDQSVAAVTTNKYKWWQDAIKDAIQLTKTTTSTDYNPVFKISTRDQFKEFIALVNGTATQKTSGLERKLRDIDNPDADADYDNAETRRYWWYDVEQTQKYADEGVTEADGSPKIAWVTRAEAEARGYIFYRQFVPQVSDKAAYSVEDYVRGPISFFDEQVTLHLVVQLTADIDLCDWELESIGSTAEHPFMGFFDGGTHTISNVNVPSGYLFGNVKDGEIRDLKITSTHKLGLLNSGTTTSSSQNLRIVGISLKADCDNSPIAQSLLGTAYVVGCIHEGDAGAALVGTANNLTMYGCMHATSNLTGAALLGSYASGRSSDFFAPQADEQLIWSNFMCNYYQHSFDQATYAVGGATIDRYRPQEYIRGARQHVLRAKNDNLLGDDIPYDKLTETQKEEFYGLAPWKAMNYAIYQYNKTVEDLHEYHSIREEHRCMMKYEVSSIGYAHLYPELVSGTPTDEVGKNILYLNN